MAISFPPLHPVRHLFLWPLVSIAISLFLTQRLPQQNRQSSTLVQKYIDQGASSGGAWHIPTSWLEKAMQQEKNENNFAKIYTPQNIVDAAQLTLDLAVRLNAFSNHSNIPLIVHQTWLNLNSSTWSDIVHESVDGWLRAATASAGREFAYFLWDDDGLDRLVQTYEPDLWPLFQQLPYSVEKADVFRIVVTRWFGGIYADVDVNLLQHPIAWVQESDLTAWENPWTRVRHDSSVHVMPSQRKIPIHAPADYKEMINRLLPNFQSGIGAIYGIECDTLPDRDDYWRMGYEYPVQITNWAFGLSPHHPTAEAYLVQLQREIEANITRLPEIDPLDLTGPPALTGAVKKYAEKTYTSNQHTTGKEVDGNFDWNGLTGIYDEPGGRGKVCAEDVLILPITGFSPGRSTWYGNMGSMPESHPNARLKHIAQGSWKKTTFMIQVGKLCRSIFGSCRNWKKIP